MDEFLMADLVSVHNSAVLSSYLLPNLISNPSFPHHEADKWKVRGRAEANNSPAQWAENSHRSSDIFKAGRQFQGITGVARERVLLAVSSSKNLLLDVSTAGCILLTSLKSLQPNLGCILSGEEIWSKVHISKYSFSEKPMHLAPMHFATGMIFCRMLKIIKGAILPSRSASAPPAGSLWER